jgi:hypothetical protein
MKRGLFGGRALLAALSFVLIGLIAAAASASVSIAVTWDGLLRESTAAAVVTPVEARSAWENGRIYTYTRVRVDRAVAGDLAAGSDAWVRTLGGVVDKIGQVVEGEAVLSPGKPCLLFLHAGPPGALEVTARGQGQFPLVADDPKLPPRVVRGHSVGALLPRAEIARPGGVATASLRLAADVVNDRLVDDVVRDVAADWGRVHAP